MVEEAKELSQAAFIRALITHPNTITWGVRFQHMNLWGDTNIQTIVEDLYIWAWLVD